MRGEERKGEERRGEERRGEEREHKFVGKGWGSGREIRAEGRGRESRKRNTGNRKRKYQNTKIKNISPGIENGEQNFEIHTNRKENGNYHQEK